MREAVVLQTSADLVPSLLDRVALGVDTRPRGWNSVRQSPHDICPAKAVTGGWPAAPTQLMCSGEHCAGVYLTGQVPHTGGQWTEWPHTFPGTVAC